MNNPSQSPSPQDTRELVRAHITRDMDHLETVIRSMSDDVSSHPNIDNRQVLALAEQRASIKQLEQRVRTLRAALARTDDEDFGWCDECGNPIAVERLLSVPSTCLCIGCARRRVDQFART